ncbi:iron-sulfur cluster repair di-iron protein [Flammeovirgaceae bacterium 311]|nr:iron-sulfur cluster repair di-iron protein [Flammeovirgaceae bacterium 311]
MKEEIAHTLSKIVLPQKPAILKKFDSLKAGESMVIVNEHNPILLYYQLLADRGNTFDWEYLEKGQDHWRVKITRISPYTPEPTVGDLAARDFRMARVFQQLGIDYCCNGKKTVEESCLQAGVEPQKIWEHYQNAAKEAGEEAHDFRKWKAGFLANYILNTYHSYVKENTSSLYGQALELTEQEGPHQAAYQALAVRLKHFFAYLKDHLQREEQELYPLISTLMAAGKRKRRMVVPIVPPVKNRVKALEEEHALLGEELKRFRALTREYAIPAQSCNKCETFYNRLQAFENDLIQHIHLENNILFPKVIAAENELSNSTPFR